MTTYNGERYIEKQLLSIRNQILMPMEVIIVDDASTDNTVSIVQDFIDKNFLLNWRVIQNSENVGFVRNFHKAISLTSGDIIFLSDQDDEWYMEKMAVMSNFFTSHKSILAISSSFNVIDADSEHSDAAGKRGRRNYGLVHRACVNDFERISLRTIMQGNISPGCTLALRRELADSYIKLSDCVLPHDYEINLMAAARNGLYFLNTPLIKYRIHEDNTLGFRSKPQTRLDIAGEKLEAAKAIARFSGRKDILAACAERYDVLSKHDWKGALKLWRLMRYRRLYSVKQRAGDILYCLKSK